MVRLRFVLICIISVLIIHCSDDSPTSDNEKTNSDNSPGNGTYSASTTVTPASGGTVSLITGDGDVITLTVPSQAVTQNTDITLSTLAEQPENQFSKAIIPGLDIQPDGLSLDEPAMLTVTFADPPDSIDFCTLYWAESPARSIALAYYDDTATTIGGGIAHFSKYGAAQLNRQEIFDQGDAAEAYLDEVTMGGVSRALFTAGTSGENDPYGWKDVYFAVGWNLRLNRLYELVGDEEWADKHSKKINDAVESELSKFLNSPVDDICDPDYKQALGKFAYLAGMIGVQDSTHLQEQVQQRMEEMMDRCSSRFQLDIIFEQTAKLPNGVDNLMYGGTVEFYLPYYTLEEGEYGQLKGEGKLKVSGGGSSEDGDFDCTWSNTGTVNVTVGGKVNSIIVGDVFEQYLQIELTLDYNVYQEKECCDKDGDCHDESGSTLLGPGPGFTVEMPIENGYSISQPTKTKISTSEVTYTLHVLNNMFD